MTVGARFYFASCFKWRETLHYFNILKCLAEKTRVLSSKSFIQLLFKKTYVDIEGCFDITKTMVAVRGRKLVSSHGLKVNKKRA